MSRCLGVEFRCHAAGPRRMQPDLVGDQGDQQHEAERGDDNDCITFHFHDRFG